VKRVVPVFGARSGGFRNACFPRCVAFFWRRRGISPRPAAWRLGPDFVMNAINRMSPPHAVHSGGNSSPTRASTSSTENRQVVGVTDSVGGKGRGRDDLATSPEFRDGCVDLVGSAIELAQAMLDKLAQDVLGQNQLYRRRQETVSQQLLTSVREERCRQQHVWCREPPSRDGVKDVVFATEAGSFRPRLELLTIPPPPRHGESPLEHVLRDVLSGAALPSTQFLKRLAGVVRKLDGQ